MQSSFGRRKEKPKARSIFEMGAATFHERWWKAATTLVADPRAVVTKYQFDFEGRRQRLIDVVGASAVEITTMRYLLIIRRRVES